MKRALLLVAALALAGCDYRSDAQTQAQARAAMTIYEAARAIEIGRAPAEPLSVIKDNASQLCLALGYPYPPKPAAPPEKP